MRNLVGVVGMVCIVAVHVVMVASAAAQPRKVLVLPLDGNADPALRGRLNASVQKLARTLPADVTLGDTTFEETAAAVGCNPAAPSCAELVRTTLGVDELVYGTVTTADGASSVIVRRARARSTPRTTRLTLTADDSPASAEAQLAPLFDRASTDGAVVGPVAGTPPGPVPPPAPPSPPRPSTALAPGTSPDALPGESGSAPPADPLAVEAALPPQPPAHDNRKRNHAIVYATGGGVSLLIGLILWSNKASIQDDIDAAPTDDGTDFARLEELEGRARSYALVGNVMVLGGLALGGYGGWLLYQDREERRRVVVAPQLTPTGAAVMLGGRW